MNLKNIKICALFDFEKGKESSPKEFELKDPNGINCAVAKNNNSGFIGNKLNPIKIFNGNKILIIAQGDGGAGLAFFADGPFCANKCVWVGTPKKEFVQYNKFIGIYISTILSKIKNQYSHTKGINEEILKEIEIPLPFKENNPDWEYMENYIKRLWKHTHSLFFQALEECKKSKSKITPLNKWKEFRISDFFKIINGKNITQKQIIENSGNIPAIQGGEYNNGILGYLSNKLINDDNFCFINQDFLSLARVGSAGAVCYQDKPSFIGDKAKALIPKFKHNKYNLLFFATVLNKLKEKFDYSNGIRTEEYKNINIKLPVDQKGDPDWRYMEDYIREREREQSSINLNNWKEFRILNFNLYSSKNNLDKNKIIDGKNKIYPYITRTDNNNGLHSFISKQNTEINDGNCLTIGLDTQTCFYQDEPFYTGQNIHILRIDGANKFSYLFIAAIIKKKIKQLFSWGANGATLGRLKQENILLPIKIDGSIDFDFMENYIKSLPYSNYL